MIDQFSSNDSELIKFTGTIKVLKILIKKLSENYECITTVRDIYYMDVNLFQKNQLNTKKLLSLIIEESLNWSIEEDLKIFPSQKGLIFGECKNLNFGNCILNLDYSMDPILIPIFFDDELLSNKSIEIDIIVVIEKEAVFKSFCQFIRVYSLKNSQIIPKNMLVITGKGFPDKLTRKFLYYVTNYSVNTPLILGFMDSDIYGLSIFKNYHVGNIFDKSNLEIKKKVDLQFFGCYNMIYAGVFIFDHLQGFLSINLREIKLMNNFLSQLIKNKNNFNQNESKKLQREVTRGLILFKKSEMNTYNNNNVIKFNYFVDSNSSLNYYILKKINFYLLRKNFLIKIKRSNY